MCIRDRLRTIVILFLILTTSACATRSVDVISKPIEIDIVQPNLPRGLELREPYWYVVNEENIDTFLSDVKKQSGGTVVFVAMTIADYENMAYNMQEVKRYVRELGEVIVYYRSVTIKTPEGKEPGVGIEWEKKDD